jgi:quercetin dioxygenase-like cupin family protein
LQIFESIQERVPEGAAVERCVLLGPAEGAAHVSAVIVRVPPQHEFPLHTHPRSEDCFFVLAGAGEAFGPDEALRIAAPAGVWIPEGAPHGVRADSAGMLEIGFQAPSDPTAVPFDPVARQPSPRGLQSESIPLRVEEPEEVEPWWVPAFSRRDAFRFLDAHRCLLASGQELPVAAGGGELLVVVARGAVAVSGTDHDRVLRPVAMLRLQGADAIDLRALETPTLLLAVRALAADPDDSRSHLDLMPNERALRVVDTRRRGSSWPLLVETGSGRFFTKLRGAGHGLARSWPK